MGKTYFKLVEFIERLIELKFPPINKLLLNAEKNSGIRKNFLIHGFTIALLVFSIINYFGAALRYITAYLYPTFCTLEALSTKNQQEMIKWLKYWAVYGFLQVFECLADNSFDNMPTFHILKTCLVLWCYAPIEENGANFIFDNYLLPAFELMKNSSLLPVITPIVKPEDDAQQQQNTVEGINKEPSSPDPANSANADTTSSNKQPPSSSK